MYDIAGKQVPRMKATFWMKLVKKIYNFFCLNLNSSTADKKRNKFCNVLQKLKFLLVMPNLANVVLSSAQQDANFIITKKSSIEKNQDALINTSNNLKKKKKKKTTHNTFAALVLKQ